MILVTSESIDSRLEDYHTKIYNARNDESISGPMKLFNFDEVRFDEGLALHKKTADFHQQTKVERSEQVGATDALHKAFDEVDTTYKQHLVIARLVTRGNPELRSLARLDGERSASFMGWLDDVRTFYAGVIGDANLQAAMLTYGITLEMLQANSDKVESVDLLKKSQLRESGEAQVATKLRDEALEELHRWVMDMIAIARIALANTPQLLEKLNIIVPS